VSYLTILARVAALYQLRPEDIIDPDRSARLVEARHVAMFLAFRSRPDWSEIAAAFQRNHNTVRHAVNSVSARMDTEKKFRARVESMALGMNLRIK
jgi:chromosomal replication initiation ATPase DnaA